MFNIESAKVVFDFYMLDLKTKEKKFFKDLEELLNFLAKFQNVCFWDIDSDTINYHNIYLDGFNETGYDRQIVRTWNSRTKDFDYSTQLKRYMFFDKNENLYDVRIHLNLLKKKRKDLDWERKLSKLPNYIFRRGPVPGTNITYRGHYLRHVRTANELRANSIPENKEYIRSKRKPSCLPTLYDDIPVINQKSWKEKTKERHQWAKHFHGAKVPDKYCLSDFFDIDDLEEED